MLTEPYNPEFGDKVHARGKESKRRVDGEVIGVFDVPTVVIRRVDGSTAILAQEDFEWLHAKD